MLRDRRWSSIIVNALLPQRQVRSRSLLVWKIPWLYLLVPGGLESSVGASTVSTHSIPLSHLLAVRSLYPVPIHEQLLFLTEFPVCHVWFRMRLRVQTALQPRKGTLRAGAYQLAADPEVQIAVPGPISGLLRMCCHSRCSADPRALL